MKQMMTKEDYIANLSQMSKLSRSTIFRYFAGEQLRKSSKNRLEEAIAQLKQESITTEENLPENIPEVIVSVNSTTFDQFKGNSEALSGILEEAARCGVRIRLERDFHGDRKGMGVIILGKHDPEEREERELLQSTQVPFVVVNRILNEFNTSYVAADSCRCAYDMCQHLLSNGCRRIFFWGEHQTKVSQDKLEGYTLALKDAGIPFSPDLVFSNTVPFEKAMESILTMNPRPDAFMAMDDEIALKAIRLVTEAGLRIPQDFCISGMNDLDSSKNTIPSLTSAKIPFKKLGILALETLLKNMKDPNYVYTRIVIQHKLVVRDSTKRISG
jgi:DNA-binding LacI/PurR family transcriptional regulator